MGYARNALSCIISSPTTQQSVDFYGVVSTYKQHLCPKKRYYQEAHPRQIRVIMIGQQIDVVAGDFNGTAWRCRNRDNISSIDEAFADCALPTPPALHHCGDLVRFQTTGLTSVDSLRHQVLIGIGKCACTAHFPSLAKLLAYVQPIKVAIMRHGSTWISSTGAALNHNMMSMTDEFYSKSVLRRTSTASRKGESATS